MPVASSRSSVDFMASGCPIAKTPPSLYIQSDIFGSMSFQAKIGLSAIFTATSLVLVSGTPAKAAACADNTLAALQTAGICTDALGFTFQLNSFTNFNPLDRFSFQSAGNNFQYSLQGASAWSTAGNTYSINYTVTAPSGKQLNFFTSNLSSANDPVNDAGGYSIASADQPATGPASATFVPRFQAAGGLAIYSPKLTSDTYTGSLNVTGGTIATLTGAVASQPIPSPSPVPGPLPLLGASAAFAISRKLRNRIKSEA
jgi:hypothetical protein